MSIEQWKKAKEDTQKAEEYIGLIGKTTNRSTKAIREGADATAGKLHIVEVKTNVAFQLYDGADNYHRCSQFDGALSAVVRENWNDLSSQAMALILRRETAAALAARTEVEAQLAEIKGAGND